MPRQIKPNGWQRVLLEIQDGEKISKEQLEKNLSDKKIHMYRMSNYMLDIRLFANGIVKSYKDGKKVVAYQIINPEVVQKYLHDKGLMTKKSNVNKLSDIASVIDDEDIIEKPETASI
jgi:hypothetical protein